MKKFFWTPRFARLDMKYVTMKVKDGTAVTPNEISVKFGEGNFTWSERRNIEYLLERGLIDEVREGDQEPCEISFEGVIDYYAGTGGTPTLNEALSKTGEAASWVSSDSDLCKPYAVDLELLYVPTNCTAENQETYTFADFRYEEMSYDLREATISVSGRANIIRPTTVRAAQP